MYVPKVSVIIPVYGVEKYIEKCARTLFEQTLDRLEYIFIDDCSPDNSIKILKQVLIDYPHRKKQVKFIRHEVNRGVSVSRQDGVDNSTGEYIIHCDPDDWVELDMYEKLYNTAIQTHADIVMCDFIDEKSNSRTTIKQSFAKDNITLLKDICDCKFHTYLWNKLIRKNYIEEIGVKFKSHISLWEDMTYLIPILLNNGKFIKLERALYHYRNVSSSLTHKITKIEINSMIDATKEICEYINNKFDNNQYDSIISLLQLRAKDFYLRKTENFNPQLWRHTFPNVTNLIFLPISSKRKFLYILCLYHLDLIVNILVRMRK